MAGKKTAERTVDNQLGAAVSIEIGVLATSEVGPSIATALVSRDRNEQLEFCRGLTLTNFPAPFLRAA
jgi:hypothetical protein